MHCTLLISDLLPPSAMGVELSRDVRLPGLETLLARGGTARRPPLERDGWLCSAFGVAKQQDWPVAPLTLAADGVDPEHYYWLRADPVELRVDRNRLVMAGGITDLDGNESRDLVVALSRHFARDGIILLSPCPQRWYLRVDGTPRIVTTPLARAANLDIAGHLPQGEAALYWHRLMNEAQMVLHEHVVNEAREARGAPAVNSVWVWGGGIAPAVRRPPYQVAWGGDALMQSLAGAAGVTWHNLPEHGAAWLAMATAGDHHLLVLDQLADALIKGGIGAWREQLLVLERDWIAALLPALRAGKIATITLAAVDSESLLEATLAPAQLWRFWRRARPLACYASANN